MFIGRLRELWSTIMVHSRDYEVQDTLAVSELLHVPKYYMHTGLYLWCDTFLDSGPAWGG